MSTYLERLLGEHEKIILVTHQHWIMFFQEILIELLIAIAILIVVTLTWLVWAALPWAPLGYLLLLLPLISLLRDYLIWQNHKYVVTNRRVIQIMGVINKSVTDSSLEKVNDVKMVQSAFGRLLNYGDIEILTASELGVNRFSRIADPIRFKTAMLNAKGELEKNIPALIAQLDALRQQGVLTDEEFHKKKAELLEKA